ncbi:hypothetical protein [Actinoplanes sp. RD1]|uniref:hypothetical protein n=1 Tax=Actinoplanes sp. RD1 TaxID=3064538 RepID=UPI002741A33F|nr:hypothetical protein [Actinoplanes sp. RD1]
MNRLLTRAVAAATLVSALLVLFTPRPFAVAGGLLLGFLLPGAALTQALFPVRVLTRIERTVLAPALSLATLVLGGLLLYVCRAPLGRVSWTALTAGVTVLALIATTIPRLRSTGGAAEDVTSTGDIRPARVAAAPGAASSAGPAGTSGGRPSGGPGGASGGGPGGGRGGASGGPGGASGGAQEVPGMAEAHTIMMQVVPPEDEATVAARDRAQRRKLIRQLLPLVLVVAILGGAGWLSLSTSRSTYGTTVTTLSASPPAPADADGNRTVVLKATGLLDEDAPYKVTVSPVAGDTKASRQITIDADGEWTETVTVPADNRVTIGLYRSGDDSAYRTVSIAATE